MAYNIIVEIDWIEINNPKINFGRRRIEVREKKVKLINVREDLVKGYTLI